MMRSELTQLGRYMLYLGLLCMVQTSGFSAEPDVQHVKVYAQVGRFGGWPANHGIWSWGDEILVGFSAGYHKDLGEARHNIDREKPEEHLLARSLDGGASWSIEDPASRGALVPAGQALHGTVPPGLAERPWQDCSGGINFTHPDFAMTVRMVDNHAGPSRFYYSYDRGHHWNGPFRLTDLGTGGIAARTDYVVRSNDECFLFVTAAKSNQREGRPLCMRTVDGGRSWEFVGWIGDEPSGYAIMPATVACGPQELLSVVRCRDSRKAWLDLYRSQDLGRHWTLEPSPATDLGEGNPASLTLLKDGRICLTYGHRAEPFSIRARISSDRGHSWSSERFLRDAGGGRDVGYPRTIQRTDGKLVTVYYFHDEPGSERYIAATIWSALDESKR